MKRAIETELLAWQTNPHRTPLIIRGARQVGKSYSAESFGQKYFKNLVTLNFEFQPQLKSVFETLDPIQIIQKLTLLLNVDIRPGETLLFLDEIQECPEALKSLRYFKEKMPDLHVLAAGSLLEFTLSETDFSFPVGRVSFLWMRPLSFLEYLSALHGDCLSEHLATVDFATKHDAALHQKLLTDFRLYLQIGGLPMAVQTYSDTQDITACRRVQAALLQSYQRDFGKYATKTQIQPLKTVFMKTPGLVGQQIKYSNLDKDSRSRELKIAIHQLYLAGLIHPIYATSASGLPLSTHQKENQFKLLFIDIGLMQTENPISILNGTTQRLNAGSHTEQVVGQELKAYAAAYQDENLFYWKREERNSHAEVDYLTVVEGMIIPIEVKATSGGQLKSLRYFLKEKNAPLGIRISEHPLSFHEKILSVPFYMIRDIPRLVKLALDFSQF